MEGCIAQFLTVQADIIFNFRAFRTMDIIETINAAPIHQVLRNPIVHDIGHLRVANQLIAVIAVFIMLV